MNASILQEASVAPGERRRRAPLVLVAAVVVLLVVTGLAAAGWVAQARVSARVRAAVTAQA